MRYATAVRHLETVGEAATADLRLKDTSIGYALEELWVGGDVLEGLPELDVTCVVLVLDEPVAEVTWLALNPAGQWIAERLRMTRLPMRWCCRPAGYPAWNPELRQVVRFWSAATRLDREVMENLQLRRFDSLPVVRPSDDQLRSQLAIEAVDCRRHLRHVLDHYWEESWRREHRGFGIQPEDHLWRASEAVREIEDATTRLGSQ